MANAAVSVSVATVVRRISSMAKNGLAAASEQALTDCNFYAPQEYGVLIASSQTHSDVKKGQLEWVTPYARRLYYKAGLNIKKDINPHATQKWVAVAQAAHSGDWLKAFKKGMK